MSELTVRPIEAHEEDTWDEFVEASPQGTIFHTSDWMRAINSAYAPRARMSLLGCFDAHGIRGGCVALERSRLGKLTAVTPLLTAYSGFLLDGPDGEKISDQISIQTEVLHALAARMSATYSYQCLMNPPHLDDTRPLQDAGYHVVPRFTYHINLRLPHDELWARFDGSVRRQIKKAEKTGFEVSDNFDVKEAWRLFEDTFRRHKQSCPVDRRLFDEIAAGDHLRGSRQYFCAYLNGRLASFIVLLSFDRTLYYALAGTDAEFLPSGVSSFLIWEVLGGFANKAWNNFDFVGANTASIARFKEGFNPRLVTYFQAEYFRSSYVRLGKSLSRLLKK